MSAFSGKISRDDAIRCRHVASGISIIIKREEIASKSRNAPWVAVRCIAATWKKEVDTALVNAFVPLQFDPGETTKTRTKTKIIFIEEEADAVTTQRKRARTQCPVPMATYFRSIQSNSVHLIKILPERAEVFKVRTEERPVEAKPEWPDEVRFVVEEIRPVVEEIRPVKARPYF
jgi:hypothetical protein